MTKEDKHETFRKSLYLPPAGWGTLNTLKEKLSRLARENKELREKLSAYENGCVCKGSYCEACQNSRKIGYNAFGGYEYICVLNVPCGEFNDKHIANQPEA